VSVSVVAHAAIVPLGQALGTNTEFAPAPRVVDNQGEPIYVEPSFTGLY